ncbi:baseplate multidomain protein megatron [Amaricoccus solimangrovi]|uniref:Host specificity protein n=1 Tax=Amaricoccus solimangrovi TaxID=2589815 RepID=A0A501WWG4_9RHOB|nr:glycoside hydrolase/phage tail family protein [Amaricoccus solimangrovi]TPE52585.1 hypothetical protein FJM51_05245 [Amaricoccus solimangrovi]
MATLALTAAASSLTAGIGGFGGALLGAAAVAGAQVAGGLIDGALFGGTSTTRREGARLGDLDVMSSTEGAGIPWVLGRARVAGSVIWATRIREVARTEAETYRTGKTASQRVETTDYSYSVSFALAVAETRGAPVRHFGRVWADNRLLDVSGLEVRFYHGTEDQDPDPLITAVAGAAPAYRGIAYVVFEDLPLADYGNRIPQMAVEVFGATGEAEDLIRGVDLIPGSTEWGYMPTPVKRVAYDSQGEIISELAENSHRLEDVADWSISLDTLRGTLPNVGTVALVVSWFGDDLRAGRCTIAPRVEFRDKETLPAWSAGGLDRAAARLVSLKEGRPVYGSTPADISVVEAIRDLRARGLRVVLYPFIMMDIPAGSLPDPSGSGTQPENPWRGRIRATAGASVAAEVAAFLGAAAASDFGISGDAVSYSGPAEWSYRRFVLHLAHLAKAAGGVDAFLIGSETVGLTQSTESGSGVYPFVTGLVDLAGEVAGVLPSALISYAADWSEYHSHRPGDGSGDVFFNLDPLWSSPHVDFVAIDNYLPMADWRPGVDHLDYDPAAGRVSIYDLEYLKANVEGGEFFDWYYASDADRAAQVRTPIADGAHGEDWIFRQKAIRDWFGNAHRNRPGGVRSASATGWTPNAKPLWFTECGCPAVDHGANQPNIFAAINTSESGLPRFSGGVRDDFMPRQYLRALIEWWRDNGAAILDPANVLVWAWDARPWPEFPNFASEWADASAWRRGHWLNGRAGAIPAADAIKARLATFHDWPAEALDLARCHGQADGYAVAGPLAFRDWSQPWEIALRLDASLEGGTLAFASRAAALPAGALTPDALIDAEGSRFTLTRSALEDATRAVVLSYVDGLRNYETGAALAAIEAGVEDGTAEASLPLVLDADRGRAVAETILRTSAAARERIAFALPPSADAIRPGMLVSLDLPEIGPTVFLVEKVARGETLAIEATIYDRAAFAPSEGTMRGAPAWVTPAASRVLLAFLDLPILPGVAAEPHAGLIAAHAQPWPGGVDLYRSAEAGSGYALNLREGLRATIGETVSALAPGRLWSWSGETVDVRIFSGSLVTRTEAAVLDGANMLAIEHAPGVWEVVQFARAELVGDQTWRLSRLLRGQRGTEGARGSAPLPAGARVVVLDLAVAPVAMTAADVGRSWSWRYGPAGRDPEGAGFRTRAHAFAGIGLRPFAPVHLTARLGASGDLAIGWTRRTRTFGDAWPDEGDVPLGEVASEWRIEIRDGGGLKRSWTVTGATAATYTAAMMAADGVAAPFLIRVAQVSNTFGRGTPGEITFNG